ncbi:uncharacterized protein AMSG_08283 [Thecamonas trahens ATCC 50062]|uniref:C2 NT-type domain-containing protein n=1 Tax=Thecamonas trahens ATCC 50062 TaxID=461836 RepID=A0A0L0DIG4_THETB|nr:hypothetical protein AMSG_08283 [Thecamonas trahens ATCC 50062]KNC52030.1 hypothetical protein AMSG_08283 [Thecamonas trahens ATCC 50062]|eukprot:XP_013755613.1 hypothetical protein AMSG_08283 [Thecamonas trahens ATCC 50062]
MLKAVRRIGKKSFKFKYTVTVHSCQVVHTAKMAPMPLMVAWTRGPRKAFTHAGFVKAGVIGWESELSMVATLYQESDGSGFEKKMYKFALKEDQGKKGGKKTLAAVELDLAEFASLDASAVRQAFDLKPASSMVRSAELELTIACAFLAMLSSEMGSVDHDGAGESRRESRYREELLRETEAYGADGARVAELETQLELAQASADAAAQSWTDERAVYEATIAKLKSQVAREKAKAASIKDELAEARASAGAAGGSGGGSDDGKYRALAKQLEGEVRELEEDITAIEDENEVLMTKCRQLVADKKAAEAEAAALRKELVASKQQRSASSAAEATAASSAAELEAARQEAAAARVQVRELEAQNAALERRLRAMPQLARTTSASGHIRDIEIEREALGVELETTKAALRELEGELIGAKMASAEAAFELETLRGEKRGLAKQLAKAKLAYNALSERMTEMEVKSL